MDHQSPAFGLFSTPKYLLPDPVTRTCHHYTEHWLAPVTGGGGEGWSCWTRNNPSPTPMEAALLDYLGKQQTHDSSIHYLFFFFYPCDMCDSSPQLLGKRLGSLASRTYFQTSSSSEDEAYFTLGPSANPPCYSWLLRSALKWNSFLT